MFEFVVNCSQTLVEKNQICKANLIILVLYTMITSMVVRLYEHSNVSCRPSLPNPS